jgi:hypothetical protein
MDHPLLKGEPYTRAQAFEWMIGEARWKDEEKLINGKMIALKRGQFSHSIRFMADKWGWTKKRVELFIGRLKQGAIIGTNAGTGQLIITICNYGKYQDKDNSKGDSEGDAEGTARGHEGDKEKESKEVKEIKKIDSGPRYAFEGQVIKLNQRDFNKWQETYHAIPDLRAQLFSLDGWFVDHSDLQPKWFHIAKRTLNKDHQENLAKRPPTPTTETKQFMKTI